MKHSWLIIWTNAAGLIFLAVLSTFLLGCELWGAQTTVECQLPATPQHWAAAWGEPSYSVNVVTSGESHEFHVPAGVSKFILSLPKETLAPVIAYPCWDPGPGLAPGESMRPAGAVWPLAGAPARDARSPARLELSYELGFAAEVVGHAMLVSRTAATFNVLRFVSEVADRAGHDPWRVDSLRLVAAISGGSMRADYIRPEPSVRCTVDLPGGPWHSPSPFRDPVGGLVTLDLPIGISTLYATSGERALFHVDEEGRCWSTQPRS